MRANEVEEEHKCGNQIVRRIKVAKAVLRFVPNLELLVETFDKVVVCFRSKAFNLGMRNIQNSFNGRIVGVVSVGDNGIRFSEMFYTFKGRKSLR